MPANPSPQIERALAPLLVRLARMDPTDRFHEASSMLEGCRQGLTTFADVRLGALRELERYGYNRQQIADATGLSRQRIEQLLKDR